MVPPASRKMAAHSNRWARGRHVRTGRAGESHAASWASLDPCRFPAGGRAIQGPSTSTIGSRPRRVGPARPQRVAARPARACPACKQLRTRRPSQSLPIWGLQIRGAPPHRPRPTRPSRRYPACHRARRAGHAVHGSGRRSWRCRMNRCSCSDPRHAPEAAPQPGGCRRNRSFAPRARSNLRPTAA